MLFCLGLLAVTGCGGSTGGGSGPSTPTVTVSANPSSITIAQGTTVTVTVSGSSGTATGSVTLSSGTYSSGAVSLSGGSAQITIAAGSLATGSDTLTATYSSASSSYNNASGTGSVTVTAPSLITPTVTVSPNPSSITTAESTAVTVTVSSGGNPTPTGSVKLTSGSYNSVVVSLNGSGSALITIPASSLSIGSNTVTANYTPDTNSSSTYNSATGTGSVTVTSTALITPTVTVSANPSSIGSAQSTTVTVTVSSTGNPTPTGSVTLTSGTYSSDAQTLTSGSVQITIAADTLSAGTDLLTAKYTPDANSSSTYNNATGTGTVTVTGSLAIDSFTANPNPIPVGSSSTNLTAVFTGGTGVITPGPISVTSNKAVSISPTTTTVYTLTVTPTSGSAITQTLTVTLDSGVTVNPSNPGIAVTNQILGMNLAAWYNWPANASSINSAFNGAGIKAIRWPGGSWSDDYHWGYQSGSSTLVPSYMCQSASDPGGVTGGWGGYSTFAAFVRAIPLAGPFDLALTANYGTNETCTGGGDPAEAAAWAAAAVTDGITVSHITVGNEEYGSWEDDLHAIKHDPTTYAAAVKGSSGYYDLIKAANSGTLVGVVVDANCTTANGCTDGWDSTVLGTDAGYYDFVEYHYYPQNPGGENDTNLTQTAPVTFTTNIETIKNELTAAGEANTPIYVGEIGSVSSNPGKQSWSITQGLYAAQILGEMMNDGVARSTWWIGFGNCNGDFGNDSSSVYGWQNFGAYNVFADGYPDTATNSNNVTSPCDYDGAGSTNNIIGTMSPTAVAFDLFSNVAVNGEHVLTPAVTGDTTNVRVYAATHSGGTALVLFNLNETTPQTVQVTVTGKSSSAGVTEYTYDKELYDYTNTGCEADQPLCTYNSNWPNYGTVDWVGPATTALGAQTLPMTVTLQPWSMNVFIIE